MGSHPCRRTHRKPCPMDRRRSRCRYLGEWVGAARVKAVIRNKTHHPMFGAFTDATLRQAKEPQIEVIKKLLPYSPTGVQFAWSYLLALVVPANTLIVIRQVRLLGERDSGESVVGRVPNYHDDLAAPPARLSSEDARRVKREG